MCSPWFCDALFRGRLVITIIFYICLYNHCNDDYDYMYYILYTSNTAITGLTKNMCVGCVCGGVNKRLYI